jgi:hypothetical protein
MHRCSSSFRQISKVQICARSLVLALLISSLVYFTGCSSQSASTIPVTPITPVTPTKQTLITSGLQWTDTSGNPIEAHGGGMIEVGSTYYWVGEDHSTASSFSGINCYSSTDLLNWTFVNNVLPVQPAGLLAADAVVQRPKILYNAAASTYVMWMHIDNSSYSLAEAGVATSPTVCGAYTFLGASQPLGFQSRDMGLFEDSDGTAYLLSEDRANGLRIDQLSSNYQTVVKTTALLPDMEAPALVKVGSTYYMFCSYLTGWSSNDNEYATATSLAGPWSALQDFAPAGTNTFNSQTNYVLPVTGTGGTSYIYMGDRWNSANLALSTYVWLPLTISNDSASMAWYNRWSINIPAGTWAINGTGAPTTGVPLQIVNKKSGLCLDVTGQNLEPGVQLEQWTCNGGANQNWILTSQSNGAYTAVAQQSGLALDVLDSSKSSGAEIIQNTLTSGSDQNWTFNDQGNGYYTLENGNSSMCVDVGGASITDGALLEQETCSSSDDELWTFQD